MKKQIAILFLFLLFVQAIPVVQMVSAKVSSFSIIDEDKPDEVKLKDNKAIKEFIFHAPLLSVCNNCSQAWNHALQFSLPSPYIETHLLPPDTGC